MTTASDRPRRTAADLTAAEREELERAHRRLRDAVRRSERFRGSQLEPGQDVVVHDAREMATAWAELDVAEADLWRLRQQLLGWARPAWAPRASLVSDWFSDEDRAYDDVEAGSSS